MSAPQPGRGAVSPLDALLPALAAGGLELRHYRPEVVARAIDRSRALTLQSEAAFLEALGHDAATREALGVAIRIQTTAFFRDGAPFKALRDRVLPDLLARCAGRPLRVWVQAVSTGEEAYTVALLLEALCARRGCGYQVLATDCDPVALDVARAGRYPPDALRPLPPELQRRFVVDGDARRICPAVRERVTFAEHDLLTARLAPPQAVLAEFDLVLCRNLLIYLTEAARRPIERRLAAVCRRGGALVLGLAERPRAQRAFAPYPDLDPALRIYRRARAA